MKFKVLSKVDSMLVDGKRYLPGDIVDLPSRYRFKNWLQPVKTEKKKKPAKPVSRKPVAKKSVATKASKEKKGAQKGKKSFRGKK